MSDERRKRGVPCEVTELAIGTQPWIGYGPFYIADAHGCDTDHGVDIRLSGS